MLGWIKIKKPGESKFDRAISFMVPDPGQLHTKAFKCSEPGILFSAEVTNIIYEIDELDAEKSCGAGDIAFVFHEKSYADSLRKALANITTDTGPLNAAAFISYKEDLNSALEMHNVAAALTKSSELYNALLAAGAPKAEADPYRILSLDLAQTSLKSAGVLAPGVRGLTFDPEQKKIVLDNVSVKSIRAFQSTNNLSATGNLNWNTMKRLQSAIE